MILGVGTDIIEIDRIKHAIESNIKFVDKVFTKDEIKYIFNKRIKYESAAGMFCAKEAVSKALGSGVNGFKWTDIEISRDFNGKPQVILYNHAYQIFIQSGMKDIQISISHSREYAIANAVAF